MSNVQSYNALIDRFKAFASGHFILKSFSHGQIDTADLEKFTEYPFMHVVPSNVTYAKGMKTFSFQIVLADLPRDKDDKVEFQREVLSDLQRIAEDLVAEITNHRVLFGDLITVQNVSLEPFLEEFHNTLTGWTVSLDLLVPYYWDACSIPAEWNDFFESGSGGTGSILTFVDSITRDENGNVSLVNDEAEPAPNYYYGTNDEGVRGWYLLTDEVGLTCATIGTCQTIIDIEAAIDDLQEEIALKANTADLGAVAFSNDYNDLDNKPTIPDVSGFVPYTGATQDVDLGTYNLTADHIALNVSPSGAGYVVGATQWNNTIGSSETLLKGGSVSLKNGVDLVARVVNKVTPNTTLTKAAYQAVRVSGAQGQRLAIELAQANNDNNSADTIGIVCETIATNQEGFIQTVGQLEGINTTGSLQGETWADGDVLYLSPTTAGALTNIKPTGATGHIVVIGYVEYAHANNGKIYVKVMNGWELDELHNVYINSPANNNVLTYESSTSLWKNKTVETALGYTPVPTTRTLTINGTTQDLSADRTFSVGTFNLPSLTSGSVLFSNGTTIAQDNTNLFWDDTNNRLGIGTASPSAIIHSVGSVTAATAIARGNYLQPTLVATANNDVLVGLDIQPTFTNGAFTGVQNWAIRCTTGSIYTGSFVYAAGLVGNAGITISSSGTNNVSLATSSTGSEKLRVFGSTGNVTIQNGGTFTDAGFRLDVNGTARFSGSTTFGTLGTGTGMFWNNTNNRLGIGTNSPTEKLTINGNAFISRTDTTTQVFIGVGTLSGVTPSALFWSFGLLANSNDFNIQSYDGTTLSSRLRIFTTGNVAIGTTTDAGYRLDVNGTARVQGELTLGNNLNLSADSTYSIGTSTVRLLTLNVRGIASGSNTLDIRAISHNFADHLSNIKLKIFATTGNVLIQNGGTFTEESSAQLAVNSTTRGFLPPRMTTTQKNAIASPAAGLVVYDTTLGKLCVRTASAWETITSA